MERAQREMTTFHDDEVYQTLKDEQEVERSTSCTSPDSSPEHLRVKDDSSEYVNYACRHIILLYDQ